MQTVCPIRKAFDDIRTGGYYDENCIESSAQIAYVGGAEYICDGAIYYLMQQKILRARAKAAGNILTPPSGTFVSNYNRIMKIINLPTIEQIHKVTSIITMCEELILKKIRNDAANISLPQLMIGEINSPSQLQYTVNSICDYMNRLNINSILNVPSNLIRIEKFHEFIAEIPDVKGLIPLGDIDAAFDAEEKIILYCAEVEKYHCEACNHLGKVVDNCQQIVMGLQ